MIWQDVKKTQRRRTRHYKKRNPVTVRHFVPYFKFTVKAALFAGVLFLGSVTFDALYSKLLTVEYFYVQEMIFSGCEKANEDDLYEISGVDHSTSMLALDLKELTKKIKRHPWVKDVAVKKQMPDKVYIGIKERKPVAIVNIDNLYYVDSDAVVFEKLKKGDPTDFLLITGLTEETAFSASGESKDLLKEAVALVRLLSERDTFTDAEVSEINLNADKGITLFTYKNAIPIKVGFRFSHERFDKLDRVFAELKRRSITPEYIDIDYDKRVVVKVADPGDKGGV